MMNSPTCFAPVDRPDCPECARAREDANHAIYLATCLGCATRAIAITPEAWRALNASDPDPLRQAILRTFGEPGYLEARRRVWEWYQTIQRLRRQEAPTA